MKITSSLNLTSVLDRMKSMMDEHSTQYMISRAQIEWNISKSSFLTCYRASSWLSLPFKVLSLRGRVQKKGEGTLIHTKFEYNASVWILGSLFLALALIKIGYNLFNGNLIELAKFTGIFSVFIIFSYLYMKSIKRELIENLCKVAKGNVL